jgi:terminal uridylyltransferase
MPLRDSSDKQDPFEITYNVARTVTKDGLYTIRGEFMRATRVRDLS